MQLKVSDMEDMPIAKTSRATFGWVALTFLLAFAVVIFPLLSNDLPPLVDYPNHLVRTYLIADGGRSADLREFYRINWAPLPNLAMDAIVPVLLLVMPLTSAGKVFLGALLFLNAGGIVLLHRTIWRQWHIWPCLSFLLLYNRIFLWGFVNFLFGLGLAFCTAAAWAALMDRRPIVRATTCAALAMLVYFCHIAAFGILVLIVFGLEAPLMIGLLRERLWTEVGRRTSTMVAAVVPTLLVFLITWAPSAGGTGFAFESIGYKIRNLTTIFQNYNPVIDLVTMAMFFGSLSILSVTGRLKGAPVLTWWLAVFVPIYAFLPTGLLSGSTADRRLPIVISMLLVAGTSPRLLVGRFAAVVTTGFVMVFVVRMALVENVWLKADRVYRQDKAILSLIPDGAKLGVAAPWEILEDTDIPEVHVPTLAVVLRRAFVPTVFAIKVQQPLEILPPWRELADIAETDKIFAAYVSGDLPERARLADVLPKFDYIIFLHREPFQVLPDRCLSYVQGTKTFQLFKVTALAGRCPV